MTSFACNAAEIEFLVVHPLFDEPEEKKDVDAAGAMKMTKSVKYSLMALRMYLIFMVGLVFYRVLSGM
ncbi:hypothetical protein [Desulfotomaculum copahuensis]|uniref:Uncharacterized protein n=1 Tax=Desulfotomaculum copahuensis TaxID=1838280 RepID=A0A1B7LGI7_9FIRM|nr:hypothetical protein [Desulfotomaculum copahuensis]OAT85204.1 hypothetical protein A6M21_06555 [Desulfotomaculum copahuensis]